MNPKMISNNSNITDNPSRNFEKVVEKDKYVNENNNNNLNLHNNNNNDSQQHNFTLKVEPQDFSIYNKNIDYSEYDNNSTLSETDATVAPLQRPMNNKVKISTTTTIPTATMSTKDNKYNNNSFNKNLDSNDNGENYVVDKIYIMNGKDHLKDIHNYSKLPEESIKEEIPDLGKNSEDQLNDESLDEYEDCNEEEKLISNLEGKLPPDHHARRPMNAFLIFCKRHRAIVREKYPNLENRSITKILGDWWSNLGKEEKLSFTNLAKQYKDAFFSANPTFKWYKLPAPPRRTLSTRPGNADRIHMNSTLPFNNYADYNIDNNNKHTTLYKKDSFGKFKLADEREMGGLSSLWRKSDEKGMDDNNFMTVENATGISSAQAKTLPDGPSESSAYFTKTSEPFSNMKTFAAKMQNNKRKHDTDLNTDARSPSAKKFSAELPNMRNDSNLEYYDDDGKMKPPRTCKGKRYQEFMTSVSAGVKKTKHSPNEYAGLQKHNNCSDINNLNSGGNSVSPQLGEQTIDLNKNVLNDIKSEGGKAEGSIDDSQKLYDASDFDLEDKISSLPCLSLENYLCKKRETKKKKKINNKSKSTNIKPVSTIQEVKEKIKGSQKRKARKESITRRDIIAIGNIVDDIQEQQQFESLSTEVHLQIPRVPDTVSGACETSDLFGLATLAAVAANEFKIDDKHEHKQL